MNKKLQTKDSLLLLIQGCSFCDWNIELKFDNERPYVQLSFMGTCEYSGKTELQSCRKYTLSYEMCDSEVVRTVFVAINQAMLHELEEKFKFKGRRIYNPHRNVHTLWEISNSQNVDTRQPL